MKQEEQKKMNLIEELSMNAHPALNSVLYDGWVLRFAKGFTNRANSVNILAASSLPYDEKIEYCEKQYQKAALPTVFKLTPFSMELDAVLKQRGYQMVTPTNIMCMDITRLTNIPACVQITEGICPEWEKINFDLHHVGEKSAKTARKIHKRILSTTFCATIREKEQPVASAMCVVERGFAGLYDVVVSKQYRRQGYGQLLCTALFAKAAANGAKEGYLQVVADNEAAKRLYQRMGFQECYPYWYLVK